MYVCAYAVLSYILYNTQKKVLEGIAPNTSYYWTLESPLFALQFFCRFRVINNGLMVIIIKK